MRRGWARFALSHHPGCTLFAADVVVLGRRQMAVCAGCLAFWPALVLGFPVAVAAAHAALVGWPQLALAGAALLAVQAGSYAGAFRSTPAKMAAKAAFGLGVALGAAAVVTSGLSWTAQALTLAGLGLGATGLQTLRLRKIWRTCAACPWRRDWAACPGFAPLNAYVPGTRPTGAMADLAVPGRHPVVARPTPSTGRRL